jgi:hypothetical protein
VLFLLLHVVGNAAFLLLVRVGRGARFDYPTVGLTNYATAALLGGVGLAAAGLEEHEPLAALFGAVNGAQYQLTYQLMYVLFGLVGVAVTTSIMRLSVVVPVLASILVWNEWPNAPQAAGLAMAAVALPLLSGGGGLPSGGQVARLGNALLIAGTLLISGCGLLAAKAFAELGRPEQRPVYVLTCYVVATVFSLAAWPARKRMQGARTVTAREAWKRSVALGAVVGAFNIGQIWVLRQRSCASSRARCSVGASHPSGCAARCSAPSHARTRPPRTLLPAHRAPDPRSPSAARG